MRKYYIQKGNELSGPYSTDELAGQNINFHSRLCEQGTNEWKPVQDIPDYEALRLHIKPDLDAPAHTQRRSNGALLLVGLLFFAAGIAVGNWVLPTVMRTKAVGEPEVAQAPVDSLPTDTIAPTPPPIVEVSVDTHATDFAYLISGIAPERMQSELANNSDWVQVETAMAEEWDRVTQEKILPISEWRSEMETMKSDSGTLFYPFAGADFLYSNCFFPNADTIIMVGLEPLGTIPQNLEFNRDFEDYVRKIKSALYTSNRSGYFMTINMGRDLRREDLNGVLPLILFYAIRQNYLVSRCEYVKMSEEGKSIVSEFEGADGVVITLTDRDKKKVKRIEYYRTDLSNDGFTPDSPFYRYVSAVNHKMVFLKAASYLLHNSSFSNIRDAILTNTRLLLQDDSGMPFSFFTSDVWTTNLYGKYTRPIGL
ncbi:MAG: GYF domain-containing protein, partial [Flavobacteriales bacterium]